MTTRCEGALRTHTRAGACRAAVRNGGLGALPALGALLAAACLLAGCAGAPLPPAQWVRLPAQPPAAITAPATPSTQTWQLLGSIALPGHLDHSALLLPGLAGRTRLLAHPQLRWAEPLRDAVPRLLRQDLEQALGAPLWTSPLPATLQPTRQLRLELLALDAQAAPTAGVTVQARWVLSGPGLAPQQGEIAFLQLADAGSSPAGDAADTLVLTHRQALATLAQRLAQTLETADPADQRR